MLPGLRPRFDQPTSGELRRLCIDGDYTPLVGTLLRSSQLEHLTASILAKLRPVSLTQREIIAAQILKANERERRERLPPAKVPEVPTPRPPSLAGTIRRDGVG